MINHNDFMRAKWKTDREKERRKKNLAKSTLSIAVT